MAIKESTAQQAIDSLHAVLDEWKDRNAWERHEGYCIFEKNNVFDLYYGNDQELIAPYQHCAIALGYDTLLTEDHGHGGRVGVCKYYQKRIEVHVTNQNRVNEVWYHELAHAVHNEMNPRYRKSKYWREIVAELTAVALMKAEGLPEAQISKSLYYIQRQCAEYDLGYILEKCRAVVPMVEKVLRIICAGTE